eukprot:TRINITY_DN93152_c0_g1_i1.p1 TRINITY_DN93152_c0_g1~~TRINITY_DN93152_c0_g1_i1.p1  ORF type:complete len:523 (+),score=118.13 TRINITY_DN93152_c0_g1_i1:28-1569(+)
MAAPGYLSRAKQEAALVQKREREAEEARRNREKAASAAAERQRLLEAKAAAPSAAWVGNAASVAGFEFAAEASFMQGRAEAHMNRHVIVKDLIAAAKALKMPIDSLDKPVALFAVYDGHFGPKNSEYCSQNFHKKLLPRLSKVSVNRDQTVEEQVRASLTAALVELDQEFLTKFRTDRSGSCPQIVLLVGRRLYLAALGGDANTLLCSQQGGEIAAEWASETLARSPRLADEAEVERVQQAGGIVVEVAPGLQHVAVSDYEKLLREYRMQAASGLGSSGLPPMSSPFSRALGDRELKTPHKVVSAIPEIRTIWLEKSHTAFAIFCDGVSDVMGPEDICSLLRAHVGNERKAAGEITQQAYARNSEENLTAITVYFRWPSKRSHGNAFATAPSVADAVAAATVTKPETHNAEEPSGKARKTGAGQPMGSGAAVRKAEAAAVTPSSVAPGAAADEVLALELASNFGPELSLEALQWQNLREAGKLWQDEDGDVAHEFLEEERSLGLAQVQCLVTF